MAIAATVDNGGEDAYALTADAIDRISSAVSIVERSAKPVVSRQAAPSGAPQRILIRAKLSAELEAEGSAEATVWYYDGTNDAASEDTIDVYDWMLAEGQTMAADTKIVAMLDVASGRYYVIAAECG